MLYMSHGIGTYLLLLFGLEFRELEAALGLEGDGSGQF